MENLKRWVLLRHNFYPGQPFPSHFDLLLEDGLGCRTWRLDKIPVLDGPFIEVTPLPVHTLVWLGKRFGLVSGGRGWVRRVIAGLYRGSLPQIEAAPVLVELQSADLVGTLEIQEKTCQLRSAGKSFHQNDVNTP